MAAPLVAVADAVKAALDAAELSKRIAADRAYAPTFELADLIEPKLTVVPAGMQVAIEARAPLHQFDYLIDVAVHARVEGTTPADLDPWMAYVGEVVDLLRGVVLTTTAGRAACIAIANAPAYSPAHLDERRVFLSLVTLTFRLVR